MTMMADLLKGAIAGLGWADDPPGDPQTADELIALLWVCMRSAVATCRLPAWSSRGMSTPCRSFGAMARPRRLTDWAMP